MNSENFSDGSLEDSVMLLLDSPGSAKLSANSKAVLLGFVAGEDGIEPIPEEERQRSLASFRERLEAEEADSR